MRKTNGFLANTKGQLDINLAVTAIIVFLFAAAFCVVIFLVLPGIINHGAGMTDGAFYEDFANSIDLMGPLALVGIILLIILLFCLAALWLWSHRPSSE